MTNQHDHPSSTQPCPLPEDRLDRTASPTPSVDISESPTARRPFGPGHPWHYPPQGDHLPALPVEQIEPGNTGDTIERDLPKDSTKREHALRKLLAAEQAELAADIERYRDIAARGTDALSSYDREIAFQGDLEMAVAGSLSLKHNHMAWHKGRIAFIETELDRYGPLLL